MPHMRMAEPGSVCRGWCLYCKLSAMAVASHSTTIYTARAKGKNLQVARTHTYMCTHAHTWLLLLLPLTPSPRSFPAPQPDAVSCVVLGTESGRLLILSAAGTSIVKNVWLGATPALLAVQVRGIEGQCMRLKHAFSCTCICVSLH